MLLLVVSLSLHGPTGAADSFHQCHGRSPRFRNVGRACACRVAGLPASRMPCDVSSGPSDTPLNDRRCLTLVAAYAGLQLAHERDEVRLLLLVELQTQHEVEELNGILEG